MAAFFQGIGAVLGLTTRTASAVSLSLEDMEVSGLDSLTAVRMLDRHRISWIRANELEPHRLLALTNRSNPGIAQGICLGDARATGDEAALIHVVNRVYYARRIAYQLLEQSELATQIAARVGRGVLPVAGTRPDIAAPLPGLDLGQQVANAAQRAAGAGTAAAAAVPGAEGGSISVTVGTFGNLALVTTLPRPMAVGFNNVDTFSVRGSLLLLLPERHPPGNREADEREGVRGRRLLRAVCQGVLRGHPRRAEAAVAVEGRTPIERLVCRNTVALSDATGDERLNLAACSGTTDADDSDVFERLDPFASPRNRSARTLN